MEQPLNIRLQFGKAVVLHQSGELTAARVAYECILEEDNQHAGAWHMLGVALHQAGESAVARQHLERSISIRPDSANPHNNLGVVLRSLGEPMQALNEFRRAVELKPDHEDALRNLARTACAVGKAEFELPIIDRAVAKRPGSAAAWHAKAIINFATGNLREAIIDLKTCLRLSPADRDAKLMLVDVYFASRQGDEAAQLLEEFVGVENDSAELTTKLGAAHELRGDIVAARRSFGRAITLDNNSSLRRLRQALACPIVFGSQNEIMQYRGQLQSAIDEWRNHELAPSPTVLVKSGCRPPYPLSHLGENNAPLFSALSDGFSPSFPKSEFSARPSGPQRVGFVVSPGDDDVFCHLFLPLVEGLATKELAVTIVCQDRSVRTIRKALRQNVSLSVISDAIEQAAEQIKSQNFDVLLFNRVGSSSFNYFLAHYRLAPVQCTSLGFFDTTGVRAVDYFLSSDFIEAPPADGHYRETLVRLPAIPYFPRRPPPFVPSKDRTDFGIKTWEKVYLCPQKLLKFHPSFDQLVLRILQGDPNGVMIIKAGFPPYGNRLLVERMQGTLGKCFERVRFLPWQSQRDYLELISLADVVIDTFPTGASATVFDVFSVGTPMVVLPSEFNRGRFVLGCLRAMGLESLAARDDNDFLAKAFLIANDTTQRNFWSKLIHERAPVLWEGRACIDSMADFFQNLRRDI